MDVLMAPAGAGTSLAVWVIAGLTTAGVILRPFRLPEAAWAVAGAAALVLAGLLPAGAAWAGVRKGTDVYLFLLGMMLLAEVARREGLFDWLAALAARQARGSSTRLFALLYGVGTVVTVFLSNDATAVVLTPAVAAVTRRAGVEDKLPFLFICAFIANAASFVLPLSNPANLVIYGSHMPPLLQWLPLYALPSLLSIAATYAALRWTFRHRLHQPVATAVEVPALSTPGRVAALGILATAGVLLTASTLGLALGLPTFLAGAATAALVLVLSRGGAGEVLRSLSWGVLPLVAGLFVLVEALGRTGVVDGLAQALRHAIAQSPDLAAWGAGTGIALVSNLVNNLPAGLLAGEVVQAAGVPGPVRAAVLIGVDLGPNLSVTGSLATILWLTVLRREGETVSALAFLKVGAVVTPPALILAIGAALASG